MVKNAKGKATGKKKAAAKPKAPRTPKGPTSSEASPAPAKAVSEHSVPSERLVKSVVKELENLIKDRQSVSGDMAAECNKVYDKGGDKKAFTIARGLNALSDKRLAIVLPQLMYFIDVLGLEERAKKQGDMFPEDPPEEESSEEGRALAASQARNAAATGNNGIRQIGDAAAGAMPDRPKGNEPGHEPDFKE